MSQPERVEEHVSGANHHLSSPKADQSGGLQYAAHAPRDMSEILQHLDRLFTDAIAYLEGAISPTGAATPAVGAVGQTPEPQPVLAMLEQQQSLLVALAQEIAQERTGELTSPQLEAIVDDLERRNLHCRLLLTEHLKALERRLATGQRLREGSESYRVHESGVADARPPGTGMG